MMISETIVNLYRPYFMRALIECPGDPLRTVYGQAYLSVVERSNVSARRSHSRYRDGHIDTS